MKRGEARYERDAGEALVDIVVHEVIARLELEVDELERPEEAIHFVEDAAGLALAQIVLEEPSLQR